MNRTDLPGDDLPGREDIVHRVEAEQEEIRRDLAPAAQDPSTRRGIAAATQRTVIIAGLSGAIIVGVAAALIWENVGITIASAVCAAIVCGMLAIFLLLEREDGRVEQDVRHRDQKDLPPT